MLSSRFSILAVAASLTLAASSVSAYSNRVFLIRHGEKPSDDDQTGLSAQGMQRSQCLRNVFGKGSGYNIGYIITQDYKSDGSRNRPYQTVLPLSQDLGLTIDHHCDRDDADCAKDSIKNFASSSGADILLCWEHKALSDISKALGDKFDYPSDHFNYIYEIQNKKLTGNSPYSEKCPGLDN
ncbi:hypothetical protein CBOM_04093 [Ceraceosorus bombacis]|uniref:Phosphoglycerate mutase family protein n=1 Tax=Ceraceosorus bombacis TaxID=401625 RepID=A0A0N7LAW2_9BASI|nr:hypothetical protein CBOM_04093 [Ceraceosorus bombacis]